MGVVPLQDIRTLELTWPVLFRSAADRQRRILTKPHQVMRYVASLVTV
jgi:hypothetical protein